MIVTLLLLNLNLGSRLLPRLKCLILGHRMYVVQELTYISRRIACSRCHGDWGMNDDVRVVIPWCVELERMYRGFGITLINPWR